MSWIGEGSDPPRAGGLFTLFRVVVRLGFSGADQLEEVHAVNSGTVPEETHLEHRGITVFNSGVETIGAEALSVLHRNDKILFSLLVANARIIGHRNYNLIVGLHVASQRLVQEVCGSVLSLPWLARL